jgi:hypothetical protein
MLDDIKPDIPPGRPPRHSRTPYFESKSSVITRNRQSIDNVTDLPFRFTSTSTDLAVLTFIMYLPAFLLGSIYLFAVHPL